MENSILICQATASVEFWHLKRQKPALDSTGNSATSSSSQYELEYLNSVDLGVGDIGGTVWAKREQKLFAFSSGDGRLFSVSYPGLELSIVPIDLHLGAICSLCYSEKTGQLLVGTAAGFLVSWDNALGKVLWKTKTKSSMAVNFVRINADESLIAYCAESDPVIRLLHLPTQQHHVVSAKLPSEGAELKCLSFSTFKPFLLAIGFGNGIVCLLDITGYAANACQILKVFDKVHSSSVESIQFSPFNRYLMASVSLDKRYALFDVEKQKVVRINDVGSPLCCLSINSNGVILTMLSINGNVFVYDLSNGGKTPIIKDCSSPSSTISQVCFMQHPELPSKRTNIPNPLSKTPFTESKRALVNETINYMDVFSPVSNKILPTPAARIPAALSATNVSSTKKSSSVVKMTDCSKADSLLEIFSPPKQESLNITTAESPCPVKISSVETDATTSTIVHEDIVKSENAMAEKDSPRINIELPKFPTTTPVRYEDTFERKVESFKKNLLNEISSVDLPVDPENVDAKEYSAKVISGIIEDSLAEFRTDVRSEIQNMHLEMLRQFDIQRQMLEEMFCVFHKRVFSRSESSFDTIDKEL